MTPVQYCVPKDTAAIAPRLIEQCEHAGLLLTRYSSREAIEREATANDRYTLERDVWLKQIVSQITTQKASIEKLIEGNYERWLAMTADANPFALILQGRMIVGLGGKGALEMGITLHHTTGLPYIPGSALKGLARSYALLSLAARQNISLNDLEDFDAKLIAGWFDQSVENALLYREIFGMAANDRSSDSAAGLAVFYDAVLYDVPQNVRDREIFTLDVMTPHFSKYYRSSGGEPPTDADSPNPVTFLTVNAGLIFAFAVGVRGAGTNEHRKQARAWLRMGLQELGIGAKTASGYGVFAPLPKVQG